MSIMNERARKTLGLSLAILALSAVHFYIAYKLAATANPPGLTIAAGVFIILGLAQIGLGILGLAAAKRQNI